jgi:hypothetical protein
MCVLSLTKISGKGPPHLASGATHVSCGSVLNYQLLVVAVPGSYQSTVPSNARRQARNYSHRDR